MSEHLSWHHLHTSLSTAKVHHQVGCVHPLTGLHLCFHVYSCWLAWCIEHWRRMLLLLMGRICAFYILRLSSSCKALYNLPHHGDLLGRLGRSLGPGQSLHRIKLHGEARHPRLVSQDAAGQPVTESPRTSRTHPLRNCPGLTW